MVMLAACGTRLPDSKFETSAARVNSSDSSGDSLDVGSDNTSTDGGGDTSGSSGDTGSTGGNTQTTTGGGGTKTGTNAASGPNQASDIGVTPTSITIGTIVAENGVLGDAFAPSARGMRAWAAAINAKGGINGRKIILKTCDDREDRARDLACAQRLVEQEKVFALVGTNSRALGGASQYLNDKGVPVIGSPITNGFYRYPHFWSTYRFGYPRDGKTVGYQGKVIFNTAIYRWFKETLGVTKVAQFSYDVNESKQAGDAFAQGARLEGMQVNQYTVSFAAPSFDQAVADMQRNGTEIIFDTMDDGANRKLCDAMERRKFKVKAKVSTVVSMGDAVGTTYNDTCRNNVYIPGETIPYTSNIPEVQAFRAAFKKYQPGYPLHQWALEAWGLANMVGEYVNTPAPTRKGLEDYLRSLDQYKGKGIFAGLDWQIQDYSKPRVDDCTSVSRWLDSEGGWVLATDQFPKCYKNLFQYGATALDQGN